MRKTAKTGYYALWLGMLMALTATVTYESRVGNYNSTILAFTYKYGFHSRAMLGSMYAVLDRILPWDMISYPWVLRVTLAATILVTAVVFLILWKMICRADPAQQGRVFVMAVFYGIIWTAMFFADANFGRTDLYLSLVSILAAWLIMKDRTPVQLVVIALVAWAMMVHQAYVFMYLNIVLVLLFYRAMTEDEKRNRRWFALLFLGCLVTASALLIWFEFTDKAARAAWEPEILANAILLSRNGAPHKDLIRAEILGVNLADKETKYLPQIHLELILNLLLCSPMIVLLVRFHVSLLRGADSVRYRLSYLAVALGWLTILPNFLLKIDYGRWTFATISYFAVVLLALTSFRDKAVESQVTAAGRTMKHHVLWNYVWVYLILLIPQGHIDVNFLLYHLTSFLNIAGRWWPYEVIKR